MNPTLNYVRLPLASLKNCRDMGGYPSRLSAQTKWHRFLRSSDLNELSEEDIGWLKEYGLTSVIDLRTPDEVINVPNPFASRDDVEFLNVNVAEIESVNDPEIIDFTKFSLGDFYIYLLKQANGLAEVFKYIASRPEGTILFHCSAGKDRTGTVAMLLMDLVGVARKDIVTNYMVSFENLEYNKKELGNILNIINSHPDEIEKAIDFLEGSYSSAENYLMSIGLSANEIDSIRNSFI